MFKRAAREFKPRYGMFPSAAELREYSTEHNSRGGFIDDSETYLKMKKPEKEPLSSSEALALIEKLRKGQQ